MGEVVNARLPRMVLPEFGPGALIAVAGGPEGFVAGYDPVRRSGAIYSPPSDGRPGGWTISCPIHLGDFLALLASVGIVADPVPSAWEVRAAGTPPDARRH